MTRYAIDAEAALQIIRDDLAVHPGHQLVAPSVLRSHVLSQLYRDVREGRLEERAGRDQLERLAELKMRLLGDRVSRSTAWKLAARLDWSDTTLAEYLAVATLQADALITADPRLIVAAEGLVPLATLDDLSRA
ncbi:hypothetical protein [Agromyces allii]|uniref:Type II toxin-antitoxin system VapC family toxin n=1 Tax=Agromyces allii TaxID=393607 RepID=A0ABN2QA65_9MICO|nr:hypothetical protein [Agromyces allii]